MIVLSGGTGTPKLLAGLKDIAEDFAVIVNTAEDIWLSGNLICPDIDSVIYTLAGIIDEDRWWGIKGDTFKTHKRIKEMGYGEKMMLGDMDRATHIFRSNLLRDNKNKTEANLILARSLGVRQKVLPMCNEDIRTMIRSGKEEMHFQEFWVYRGGRPRVDDISFEHIEDTKMTKDIKDLMSEEKNILIGPSNPISSILPILSVGKMRELLKDKYVVVVSPIIGGKPVSGPAASFMRAKGIEVSSKGVAEFYKDIMDVFIVDYRDKEEVEIEGVEVYRTDTIMKDSEKREKLAKFIVDLL
jgi:LPPG:FO 2-phospho-L-lactate transferase